MVDLLIIVAGIVVSTLLAATAYAATEYYKQLLKAKKEYERARDLVEDVVLSFNRELKREAERLSNVSADAENAAAHAEIGLRKVASIEEKISPLESHVNNLSLEITKLTNAVGTITEGSSKILEKISSLNPSEISSIIQNFDASNEKILSMNSKVQELENKQQTLKDKIAGIEEQIQKQLIISDQGNERTTPIPVMPIKREKALASLTDTEVAALEFLTSEGPKTAPEIKDRVHLSREHTARLMKKLYEEGYLERETGKLPFRYSVKKEMESLLKKTESPPT